MPADKGLDGEIDQVKDDRKEHRSACRKDEQSKEPEAGNVMGVEDPHQHLQREDQQPETKSSMRVALLLQIIPPTQPACARQQNKHEQNEKDLTFLDGSVLLGRHAVRLGPLPD